MKTLTILALVLLATSAHAAPTELPQEMQGYWLPASSSSDPDMRNWPGVMHRIAKTDYNDIEVQPSLWVMWDGLCKIHDVKQLGEMDFEVAASCGILRDKTSYEMDPQVPVPITEDRYQFTLCGDSLNIKELQEPAQPQGCKIS
jgi:hypothetical protein